MFSELSEIQDLLDRADAVLEGVEEIAEHSADKVLRRQHRQLTDSLEQVREQFAALTEHLSV